MRSQSGNILFLILIAVVLFAALSYAVTQSSRGGGNADPERTQIAVADALSYVTSVRTAVNKMKLLGVAETDLCFDHASWGDTDYDHAGCTEDGNKIFHTDGGGVSWREPPSGLNDGSPWLFNARNRIPDIGTSAVELVMILPNLTEAVCREFNEAVGQGNSVKYDPDYFEVTTKFAGTYGTTVVASNGGMHDFCVQANTTGGGAVAGSYHFFATLIAR